MLYVQLLRTPLRLIETSSDKRVESKLTHACNGRKCLYCSSQCHTVFVSLKLCLRTPPP